MRDEIKIMRGAPAEVLPSEKVQSQTVHLMTPNECAELLHVEVNTLYVMKSQGRIPFRKVGHLLRFDLNEIIEWTKVVQK